mmetsp:Transcript_46311/g.142846  ORF Transcript_46311/g.142846 Transcript_46311/m.142846 type:complete len:256 (-) Transcript_46311:13-780(-)
MHGGTGISSHNDVSRRRIRPRLAKGLHREQRPLATTVPIAAHTQQVPREMRPTTSNATSEESPCSHRARSRNAVRNTMKATTPTASDRRSQLVSIAPQNTAAYSRSSSGSRSTPGHDETSAGSVGAVSMNGLSSSRVTRRGGSRALAAIAAGSAEFLPGHSLRRRPVGRSERESAGFAKRWSVSASVKASRAGASRGTSTSAVAEPLPLSLRRLRSRRCRGANVANGRSICDTRECSSEAFGGAPADQRRSYADA